MMNRIKATGKSYPNYKSQHFDKVSIHDIKIDITSR